MNTIHFHYFLNDLLSWVALGIGMGGIVKILTRKQGDSIAAVLFSFISYSVVGGLFASLYHGIPEVGFSYYNFSIALASSSFFAFFKLIMYKIRMSFTIKDSDNKENAASEVHQIQREYFKKRGKIFDLSENTSNLYHTQEYTFSYNK